MRILVTGGAGYIGSVCSESLIEAGHEVCVVDNMSEGHRDAVHPQAKLVELDILDSDGMLRTAKEFQPEAAVHFAAKALVGESMTRPDLYYQTNVTGGLNLLEAMRAVDCRRIVFSSTCATYGLPEKMPIDERCPQNPINPYGHSKLMFEQILKWYEKLHSFTWTALRYFNAAGATKRNGEDRSIETHLIPIVLDVALGKRPKISIFGDKYPTPDGTCIRDYIHVLDLADAHLKALHRDTCGAYNVGTGDGYSVLQVIEAARKITGHPIPAALDEPRPGDPPRLVAGAGKIKMDLQWKANHSKLTDIIQSAWDWRQAHPQGYGNH